MGRKNIILVLLLKILYTLCAQIKDKQHTLMLLKVITYGQFSKVFSFFLKYTSLLWLREKNSYKQKLIAAFKIKKKKSLTPENIQEWTLNIIEMFLLLHHLVQLPVTLSSQLDWNFKPLSEWEGLLQIEWENLDSNPKHVTKLIA